MLVTATETVAAHTVIRALGQVFGVVVRSRGLGGDITAGLRSIVGGTVFERGRHGALQRRPTTPEWRETPERFIDDLSGRRVSGWIGAATGERRYVAPKADAGS